MYTRRPSLKVFALLATVSIGGATVARPAAEQLPIPATPLAHGIAGGSGSTVGPDGALYVTEGAIGQVSRVDPVTGNKTPFATGLPPSVAPIGGAIDVAFIGWTAYVLVTLVGPDVNPPVGHTVGIYRIDSPTLATPIADIGAYAIANPPPPEILIDVPSGVQYAIDNYRNGFLVTDGHHNRIYRVTLNGRATEITEFQQFGNIVPTGLAIQGSQVFMAEAGPVPHLPANGKIVQLVPESNTTVDVARGAPLLVDVEFARGQRLFALAQGVFGGGDPGAPALPNTGSLVAANADGTFTTITSGLNLPTSLEFIGNTAFVVTLTGDVLKIELGAQPF